MKEMDHPIDTHPSSKKSLLESEQRLKVEFWKKKQEEAKAIKDFHEYAFPMSRLKKVLCAKKGKIMMRFDTPTFLTKACEIFVQELSFRAWMCANSHQRKIILDSDIAEAITSIKSFGFLNDILHTDQEKHNSTPLLKSTKMRNHSLINKSSTSHLISSNQYKKLQSIPLSTGYSPNVCISSPLPLTDDCPMTLPLPCLLQEACPLMPTTITPPPTVSETNATLVPPRAQPNIPNTCYMSTIASTSSYCVGYASTSNVRAQDRGAAYYHIPSSSLQFSPPSQIANNSGPIAIGIIESNHINPKVAQIRSDIHAHSTTNAISGINLEATINSNDVQHQHGSLEVVSATKLSGDNKNINWDEVDMADDSLLIEFWEDIMMNEDITPQEISSHMPELKGSWTVSSR
jgi:nuclear transcription factor Y, gamma